MAAILASDGTSRPRDPSRGETTPADDSRAVIAVQGGESASRRCAGRPLLADDARPYNPAGACAARSGITPLRNAFNDVTG